MHAPAESRDPLLATRDHAMHPHAPPLIAMRYLDLGDGTSLDLATAGRVWIERPALDEVSRLVWPGVIETLARLWHPAVATCVDFGWANAHEWFKPTSSPNARGSLQGAPCARCLYPLRHS